MSTFRHPVDVDDFCRLPADPPELREQVAELWASGQSRREWCFLLGADSEGRPAARLGYRVEATVSDPARLGRLPPLECYLYGLALPTHDGDAAAGALFSASLRAVGDDLPDILQTRINREAHPDHEARRRVLARLGFDVFQEKQGFVWVDHGGPLREPRVRLRALHDAGRDAFVAAMARTATGTLDRNDAWYQARMSATGWATEFLGFLDPGDEDGWLVAQDGGETVGFVAVSRWRETGTATITHIGVVPEARGRGYVRELLAAAARVTRRWSLSQIVADVDVDNAPMIDALRVAGYRDDLRPWHIWHLRAPRRLVRARAEAAAASVKESSPLRVSL